MDSQTFRGFFVACLIAALSPGLAACQTQPRLARFDWRFTQIMDEAPDQKEAFRRCDRAARDRVRFINDYEEQVSRYTLATIACMRIEGWGITQPPIQFVPRG
jgi:hypothetical protein